MSKQPIAYLATLCFIKSNEKNSEINESVYWVVADELENAYFKSNRIGERYASACNDAFASNFKYLGISELMPVYDNPDDEVELGWRIRDDISIEDLTFKMLKQQM